MKMVLESTPGSLRIRAYEPGRIVINDTGYSTSLLLAGDHLDTGWPPATAQSMEAAHMEAAMALEPEVILLGTGATQCFPPRPVMRAVIVHGVGLEVMDTASACRTYNVLLAEGRRVVAALIP